MGVADRLNGTRRPSELLPEDFYFEAHCRRSTGNNGNQHRFDSCGVSIWRWILGRQSSRSLSQGSPSFLSNFNFKASTTERPRPRQDGGGKPLSHRRCKNNQCDGSNPLPSFLCLCMNQISDRAPKPVRFLHRKVTRQELETRKAKSPIDQNG
ncbi:uncharacterized protein BDV14DRAFT_145901 [Aspergillus stella-maris]|uniref:uncharacterized protein n=1 Tax=Aspergillus stella-maris TaxID=1810926 RepID=UPI003CCE43EA